MVNDYPFAITNQDTEHTKVILESLWDGLMSKLVLIKWCCRAWLLSSKDSPGTDKVTLDISSQNIKRNLF